MKLVTKFPLPATGRVIFYVITPIGVYLTEEINAELLASGDQELPKQFHARNDVINT